MNGRGSLIENFTTYFSTHVTTHYVQCIVEQREVFAKTGEYVESTKLVMCKVCSLPMQRISFLQKYSWVKHKLDLRTRFGWRFQEFMTRIVCNCWKICVHICGLGKVNGSLLKVCNSWKVTLSSKYTVRKSLMIFSFSVRSPLPKWQQISTAPASRTSEMSKPKNES